MLSSGVQGMLASIAGTATAISSGTIAAGPVLFASSANAAAAPGVGFAASPTAGVGYDINVGLPALMYAGVVAFYWASTFVSFNVDPIFLKNSLRIVNPSSTVISFSDGINGAGMQTTAPANASDTGTKGSFAFDSGFIYICTSTNTWKRVAVATF